jgi:hypothetical protein
MVRTCEGAPEKVEWDSSRFLIPIERSTSNNGINPVLLFAHLCSSVFIRVHLWSSVVKNCIEIDQSEVVKIRKTLSQANAISSSVISIASR